MFIIGADMGQAQDYTALLFIEQRVHPVVGSEQDEEGQYEAFADYHVRRTERPALGTPYPVIVDRIAKALLSPNLNPVGQDPAVCALDATGVGRPVVDMLHEAGANISPITITGGNVAHYAADDGMWRVPKKELASTLQVLLQRGRVKLPTRTADPTVNQLNQTLEREMLAFSMKISTTGHATFEAWREKEHDDLVLGLGLGLWLGERLRPARTSFGIKRRSTEFEEDMRRARNPETWWEEEQYGRREL